MNRGEFGKTCFILCGGGAKGAVEVGQLKALVENGIMPDFIIGISVGTINGAKLIEGAQTTTQAGLLDSVSQLEQVWLTHISSRSQIYTWNKVRKIATFRAPALFNPAPLEKLISTLNPVEIINSPIRFDIVVSSAKSAKEKTFSNTDRGTRKLTARDFHRVVLASASIPGIFPMVEIDGELFFDGALTSPLPLYIPAKQGYDTVFILSTDPPPTANQPEKKVKHWVDGLGVGSEASREKLKLMELNWTGNVNADLDILTELREAILQAVSQEQREKVGRVFDEKAKSFRFTKKRKLRIIHLHSDNLPKTLQAFSFHHSDIQIAIQEGYISTLNQ